MPASLRDRLEADLKEAMKVRDTRRVSCIRMLKSSMLEREVALRGSRGTGYKLDDEEARAVISAYAKQRRDSIAGFRQGGREDLAAQEEAELEIVGAYLPAPLSDAELRRLVDEAVQASGATGPRDLGAVMKVLMPRLGGAADGKRVNELVRERLGRATG